MSKTYSYAVSLAVLIAAGCAQQPAQRGDGEREAQPAASAPAPKPRVVQRPAVKPQVLPNQELSRSILFKLLLAEIALQRGQANVAVQSYLDLARETRDPRIAQRATEVAWNSRFLGVALETAGIWLAADPDSQQARQVLAALLINQSRLADALPYLEKSLAADKENVGGNFLQLNALLGRHPDKQAVLQMIQKLAQPYAELPEAHYAISQAALNAGHNDLALEETRAALKLRPEWEQAALLQAQLLQKNSDAEALAYLQSYLKSHPRAADVRLSYARLLVSVKDYAHARSEFQALLKEFPDNPDVTMAVALLSLQLHDYDAAETQLLHAMETNYKDPDAARYYLGQLNEERKRPEEALRWYSASKAESNMCRRAPVTRRFSQKRESSTKRANICRTRHAPRSKPCSSLRPKPSCCATATISAVRTTCSTQAVEKNPNSAELLYDQAMAAEKIERYECSRPTCVKSFSSNRTCARVQCAGLHPG